MPVVVKTLFQALRDGEGMSLPYLEIISVGTTHNPNQCLDPLKLIAACYRKKEF
jgi:hypothetical protein